MGVTDKSRLVLHRDIFLDIAVQQQQNIQSFTDIMNSLRSNNDVSELLKEYVNVVMLKLFLLQFR